MRFKASSAIDFDRAAAAPQQHQHRSSSFTNFYLRFALRTLQLLTAIIITSIYASELHYRSHLDDVAITNEIYALVVGVLSLLTVGLHCFLKIKSKGALWVLVLWDVVMSVLYAALSGTFGGTYLSVGSGEELAPEDRVRSLGRMKAAVGIDLLGLLLWLVTSLLGSFLCCCRGRSLTAQKEGRRDFAQADYESAEHGRLSVDEATFYTESLAEGGGEKDRKDVNEVC